MKSSISHKGKAQALTIVKNAGFGVGGNIVSIFLKLGIGIIIARSIGPESFGIYVLALSILFLAEILSVLGLENAMVKFVSQFKALNDIPRLRGTVFWGIILVIVISVMLGLGLFSFAGLLVHRFFHEPALIPVLRIMAISLPFSALVTILLASLQGAKLIKYKVLVRQMLVPFMRLFCVVFVLILGYQLKGIACAYVLAVVVGALLSSYYLLKSFPKILKKGTIIFEKRKIIYFSLPLLFSGILKRIHARGDVLLIGYFLSAPMIGVYGVAQRFIPLIGIPLLAFNSIFAPIISELFADKRDEELEHHYKMVAKWILMSSLPIFTLLTFFSKEILSIFGPGFANGYKAMIILCIGQMLNAATGSAGFMLMMTGRSLVNLMNSGLLCFVNLLLNIYLIPKYGIVGAALANTLSVTAVQLLRLAEVWYFLKVHPYRPDTLKPICSCALSVFILVMIAPFGVNKHSIFMAPLLSILFLTSYVAFLWIFKLSPEDRIVLTNLKDKLLKRSNRLIRNAAQHKAT